MPIEQRAELLVREVRRRTGHLVYDDQSGVKQGEIVGYLNDGQERIFNLLQQERSTLFRRSSTITLTAGTAEYALPTDVYISHNIVKVDYSSTGNAQDYLPLELRTSKEEVSVQGYPDSYFLRDGSIIVSPIPDTSGAKLRLEYQYEIPTLDVRRGTLADLSGLNSAVFPAVGYGTLSYVQATWAEQEFNDDMTDGLVEYVTIVDKHGNIKVAGCPVLNYVDITGTGGAINFEVGTVVVASSDALDAGDYLLFGKNATTHSVLPQVAKRFLIEYACMRLQIRDANALEAALTSPLMRSLEQEVLDSFAHLEEDTMQVPITDYSYLGYDE